MLLRNISLLFFGLYFATLSAQGFRGGVVEKETRAGIKDVQIFLIDPVDSSVVGYAKTGWDGHFQMYELLKPLKSNSYQLKISHIYLADTSLVFEKKDVFNLILLEPLKTVDWITVECNSNGRVNHKINLDYGEWVYKSQLLYIDSSAAATQRYNDSLGRADSLQWVIWKKEFDRLDSLNKTGEDIYELIPPPQVHEYVLNVYEPIEMIASTPTNGWEDWIDRLLKVPGVRSCLKTHRSFYIEFVMDKAGISKHVFGIFTINGKPIKLTRKLFTDITNSYPQYWKQGSLNGQLFNFDPTVKYRMNFIYSK